MVDEVNENEVAEVETTSYLDEVLLNGKQEEKVEGLWAVKLGVSKLYRAAPEEGRMHPVESDCTSE